MLLRVDVSDGLSGCHGMRYADCHPDRQYYALGFCYRCYRSHYLRKYYAAGRARGEPPWKAAGGTARRWARLYEACQRWREKHPDKVKAYGIRYYWRNKRLYGAEPSKIMSARVKWLEAREGLRLAQGKYLNSSYVNTSGITATWTASQRPSGKRKSAR